MKLNRSRSLFWKLIKVALLSGAAMMFIVVVVTIASEDGDKEIVRKAGGSYDGVNLVEVKFEPEATGPQGEGTVNGLNLLLIDDIATEGYVKEYLTYARMAEEGKLGVDGKVSVQAILGTSVAEQGYYPGTTLPVSFVPYDSSDPKIVTWDKSKGWTLTDIYKSSLSAYGGSVPSNDKTKSMDGISSTYIGPFQQTPSYFNGSKYKATSLNKTGKADGGFFPDQLGGLAWEMNRIDKKYGGMDFPDVVLSGLMSTAHNAGEGSLNDQVLHGVMWAKGMTKSHSGDEFNKNVKLFVDDFLSIVEKSEALFAKEIPFFLWKFLAGILYLENGWYVAPDVSLPYITGNANKRWITDAYKILHPESSNPYGDAMSLINSRTKLFTTSDPAYGRTSGTAYVPKASSPGTPTLWKLRDETTSNYSKSSSSRVLNEIRMETAGHMLAVAGAGSYTYGAMLKYAGLNVDPTNPDDYMNKITGGTGGAGGTGGGSVGPDGQWVPDAASTDWLRQAGVDSSKVTRGHMAVLNTLYRYTGSYYKWGGMSFPDKNCGHTINQICSDKWTNKKGFDCADFVQMPMFDLTGDDWFRTTGGANVTGSMLALSGGADKRMYKIKEEDLQPGDIFVHRDHTGIFLKWNDSKKYSATILHTPGKNRKAGVAFSYPIKSKKYVNLAFFRFKYVDEINNNNAKILTPEIEWLDSKLHLCQ